MLKKIICLVVLVMCLGSFVGCGKTEDDYRREYIVLLIEENYFERFSNGELDFVLTDDEMVLLEFYDPYQKQYNFSIFLKDSELKNISKVKEKLDALDFVLCTFIQKYYINEVLVSIRQEYREKFLAEEFTVADFNWENIERIHSGLPPHLYEKPGLQSMHIYLKNKGRDFIFEAIEHFKTLEFVESVNYGASGGDILI